MHKWLMGTCIVALALGAVSIQSVQADGGQGAAVEGVPDAMTHQGRLVDDDNHPISGDVELTYTIWDHPTEGALVWQDVIVADVDETGFYSVELGGEDNPIDAAVLADGEAWLGVAVDNDEEMEPRIGLHSVPYSVIAGRASYADEATHAGMASYAEEAGHSETASFAETAGGVEDGSIGPEALDDQFVLQADQIDEVPWSSIVDVPDEVMSDTLDGLDCDSDDFVVFDGADWSCQTSPDVMTEDDILEVTGDTLGGLSCSAGHLPRYDGGWGCAEVDTGVAAVMAGEGIEIAGSDEEPEIGIDFGQEAGTVVEGDDPRFDTLDDLASDLTVYESCADIVDAHPDARDGVYTIKPEGYPTPTDVFCDMTYDAGQGLRGWMLAFSTARKHFHADLVEYNTAPVLSPNVNSFGVAEVGAYIDHQYERYVCDRSDVPHYEAHQLEHRDNSQFAYWTVEIDQVYDAPQTDHGEFDADVIDWDAEHEADSMSYSDDNVRWTLEIAGESGHSGRIWGSYQDTNQSCDTPDEIIDEDGRFWLFIR